MSDRDVYIFLTFDSFLYDIYSFIIVLNLSALIIIQFNLSFIKIIISYIAVLNFEPRSPQQLGSAGVMNKTYNDSMKTNNNVRYQNFRQVSFP